MNIENLYNDSKIIKNPDVWEAYSKNSPVIPLKHVMVYLTNRCNCNCTFCSFRGGNDHPPFDAEASLSEAQLDMLADDFNSLGVKAVTVVGGGEPTLHPYMKDFCAKLSSYKIYYGITTNGLRLSTSFPEFDEYLSWIRVSINGSNPEEYAKYQGTSFSAFAKLKEQLVITSKKMPPSSTLGISFLMFEDNHSEVNSLIDFLKSLNVKYIRFSIASGVHKDILSPDTSRFLNDFVDRLAVKYNAEDFLILNQIESRRTSTDNPVQDYHNCFVKDVSTCIGADGNLYTCCVKMNVADPNSLYGNIHEGFKNVWLARQQWFRDFDPSIKCLNKCLHYNRNKRYEYLFKTPFTSHDFFAF